MLYYLEDITVTNGYSFETWLAEYCSNYPRTSVRFGLADYYSKGYTPQEAWMIISEL